MTWSLKTKTIEKILGVVFHEKVRNISILSAGDRFLNEHNLKYQ